MDNQYKLKPVRMGVRCPLCDEHVISYYAKDFGNEKATLVTVHTGDRQCVKEVDLFTAHQFETRSKDDYDFGRKW